MSESAKSPKPDSPQGEPEQKNKMLIVQILSQMHSVFNKSEPADGNDVKADEEKSEQPLRSPSVDDSSSVVFEAQPVQEEEEEKVEEKQDELIVVAESFDVVEAPEEPTPEQLPAEEVVKELMTNDGNEDRVEENNEVSKNEEEEKITELVPLPSLEVDQESAELHETTAVEPEQQEAVNSQEITSETVSPVEGEPLEELAKQASSESDHQDVPEFASDNSSGQSPEKMDSLKRKNFGRPLRVERPPQLDLQGEPVEKRIRRSMRNSEKVDPDIAVKRSSRRMSKDYNRESVLQNAIARKEKSLNSFSEEKPRRSSRLNDDPKAPLPPQRSPKSKVLIRGSVSTDDGDPTSSPLRGKLGFDDQDDTASDVSSRSVRKVRALESNLRLSPKVSSKESLALDEDSVSSWQAQPAFDAVNDKPSGSPSRFVAVADRSESGPIHKEGFKTTPPSVMVVEASEPPKMKEDKDFPPPKAATGLLCECETLTSMFAKDPSTQLCRALDVFEDRLVKCSNEVDEVPMLRPCKTKPFQALCLVHFERMMRHNICPSCGAFCTQGIVNICENRHFFHKECEMKMEESVGCPHCGSESYTLYKIQLQNHRYPLFLPSTKPFHKLPVAKISVARKKRKSNEMFPSVVNEENEIVPPYSLTLPNGKVITSEGIPLPEKNRLEHLISSASSQEDVRYTYRSFYQAAKAGDAEKVLHMLGSGMSPNQASMNPLLGAAREGHLLVVHVLVQAGANLETLDKYQFTPLMLATQNKHNAVVKYLVRAGADVGFKGADGMTSLHIAAKEGNLEACHYILSEVNLPVSFIDTVDDGRWTALVWAAENCHSKVVRYLLQKKADPQIRDGEMNIALHWSAFAGSMEITEDLLNYGCSINLSNTHGDTPLHIAARQGADNCVVLLLARGARVETMNKAGQLPRDCVINKDSYCYTAIDLNMTIKKSMASAHFYPRILSNDVSGGREENPIQCVNAVDDDLMPTDYTYVTENCVTSSVSVDRRISSLICCRCEDNCSGSGCMCTKISRGSWFDSAGKLVPEFSFEDPPMLFECNPACGCNVLTCKNRVVQKGLKSRLQLCKTKDKSWGVITLKEIPKGTYVCEYIGEIISDLEADTRKDDSYLFDLDNAESETYCLDARRYGNICRFINHSCRPNLSPVKIYFQHQDLHFPRIAMFASRDIAPNEELGFDYGEKFWIIKCKSFTCHCGEPNCRYSESTIQQTLEKYQQKLRELDEMSDSATH